MNDLVKFRAWLEALSSGREEAVEHPPVADLALAVIQAEFERALSAAEGEVAARTAEEEADGYTTKYTGSDLTAAWAWHAVRNLRAARTAVAMLGLAVPLRQAAHGSPEGGVLATLTDPWSSAELVRATVAALGPDDHGLAPAIGRMLMETDRPCPPFSLLTRHAVARNALRQIGLTALGPILALVSSEPTSLAEPVRAAILGFGGDAVAPLCNALIRVPTGGAVSDWIADLLVALGAKDRLVIALADLGRATSGAAREWVVAHLLRHAGDTTAALPLLTLGIGHAYQRERAIELALEEVANARVGCAGTAEFLTDALGQTDLGVRKLALVGLSRLGPRAASAIPALRAAAANGDPIVTRMATNAIRAVENGGYTPRGQE